MVLYVFILELGLDWFKTFLSFKHIRQTRHQYIWSYHHIILMIFAAHDSCTWTVWTLWMPGFGMPSESGLVRIAFCGLALVSREGFVCYSIVAGHSIPIRRPCPFPGWLYDVIWKKMWVLQNWLNPLVEFCWFLKVRLCMFRSSDHWKIHVVLVKPWNPYSNSRRTPKGY